MLQKYLRERTPQAETISFYVRFLTQIPWLFIAAAAAAASSVARTDINNRHTTPPNRFVCLCTRRTTRPAASAGRALETVLFHSQLKYLVCTRAINKKKKKKKKNNVLFPFVPSMGWPYHTTYHSLSTHKEMDATRLQSEDDSNIQTNGHCRRKGLLSFNLQAGTAAESRFVSFQRKTRTLHRITNA